MTPDLHPDDEAYTVEILTNLRRLRARHDLLLEDVVARIGTDDSAVSSFERKPGTRRLATVQAYAYGIGYRMQPHVEGLDDITSADVDTLLATAAKATDWRRAHAYERAALGALLKAHRVDLGLTQVQVAARLGTYKTSVAHTEAMDTDAKLRTVQALARALGGQLRLRFVLLDAAAVAARVRDLIAELAGYADIAPRWKVTTPAGSMKGISGVDAWRIAEKSGGDVARSRLLLLPTGHEVLEPWLTIPPTPAESN